MRSSLIVSLAAPLILASPLAAQTFAGTQFNATYLYPDTATPYTSASFAPANFSAGSGVDTIGDIEGVTQLATDFGANTLSIVFTTTLTNPTLNATSFNGPVFTATTALPFTTVTLGAGTNLAGFDLSRVTLTGNSIGINLQGLNYTTGSTIDLSFSGAAGVPEPASWGLMIAGFVLVGTAVRRRAPILA